MTVSYRLKAMFGEDVSPGELFQNSVREIGRYARIPKRAKTPVIHRSRTSSRLLSYEQIGEVEESLIREGHELKPKFYRGGGEMRGSRKSMEKRMGKLYEVIREMVAKRSFFKTSQLMDSTILRARVTDNQEYFSRTMHEDLRRLAGQGLIYRRGRGTTSTYYLGDGREDAESGEEKKPSGERSEPKIGCLGFGAAYDKMEGCKGCIIWKQCLIKQEEYEAAKANREEREKPLIPKHVTVDININITFGK